MAREACRIFRRSGDDRTRTGACSPDKRVLLAAELRPLDSAGGIRTHDLELMRLARTAPSSTGAICPAGVEPAISGAQSRRGGRSPLQADDQTMKWEEGLASLKRGGALL